MSKMLKESSPLSKTDFSLFLSEEMTVKQNKEFEKKVIERFEYIVLFITKVSGRKIEWFDFNNIDQDNATAGFFNVDDYKEITEYTGYFDDKKHNGFSEYDESFPTSWFYTDFQKDLENEKQNFLALQKIDNEKEKIRVNLKTEHLISSIKQKLNKEELKLLEKYTEFNVTKKKDKKKDKKSKV